MKEGIHPKYYETMATCACGATYQVGSTKENIHIDICSACHPLYTGKQKLMDIEGRVQKFQKKYATATPRKKKPTTKKSARGGSAFGGKKTTAKVKAKK